MASGCAYRSGRQAERGPQRIALRTGQLLEAIQHRCQQLGQPGEGELHLRLDSHGTGHPAARRLLDHVFQQRRLAHTRFAAHHKRRALTRADSFEEPAQHFGFAAPTL